jgi:hypothetical protein
MIFVFVGIILMFFATMILLGSYSKTFAMEFIIVLLQPAGWFLFWEGLNLAIFEWKHIEPDLRFYEKLSNSRFSFYNY